MHSDQPIGHRRSLRGDLGVATLAIAVVASAITALLVPLPFPGRLADIIGDMVHAPLFGGLALGVLFLLDYFFPRGPESSLLKRSALVLLGLFSVGAVIEWCQSMFGRTAALHDAFSNGLGVLAATLAYAWWTTRRDQNGGPIPRRVLLAGCFAAVTVSWWTPLTSLADMIAVRIQFPLLVSFETRSEVKRFFFRECAGKRVKQDATDGKYALQITFQPTEYPGATLIDLQRDWSEMRTLQLDVVLDQGYSQESVEFMVKIHDRPHHRHEDTYRNVWRLRPGQPRHLVMTRDEILSGPDSRQLDLSRIMFVDLMVLAPGEKTRIRVDALRLDVGR